MEIYQLEYFLALAEYGHFGKASEAVSISLSAFSSGIKNLEKELGVALFIRGQKITVLTPAGSHFLPLAKRIIEDVQTAKDELHKFVEENQEAIRLGTLLANDYSTSFPIIIAFQKAYPNIKLELYVETTDNLERGLLAGSLNAAFVGYGKAPQDNHLNFLPMWDTPLAVLVSKQNAISKQTMVSLESVCNQKLLIEGEHRQPFEELCAKNGHVPNFELVSNSVPLIKTAVEHGVGCAILGKTVAKKLESPSTTVIDFVPTIHRKIYLATMKTAQVSPAVKAFTDFCSRELYNSICAGGELEDSARITCD